ncbi:chaperone protein DnaJ [Halogeometricum pallidum JCM 14848]|uniref:Chaperone protein DnaJ n=1 Tax=Halogeometricum pallidum JCM 14848 TaxID=1227487 RepID=M0CU69_HALPD|nr:DnaJ domain-containing protein [Halogeometricum pallidum]ELZ26766.1 chaperone protein DnaJ [Halogeometricum pallidum JCM 14848]
MDDFYDLLGVSEDAAPADVKRAWRGKAREYHPDVNDDARAGVQFKTLRAAYEVLSDETKRAAYDRMGHERYVAERLDGLPTAGMERRDDGGGRWQKRAAAAGGGSAGSASGASADSSADRTRSAGASARTGGRTRDAGRSRAESTGRSRSTTGPSRTGAAHSANRSTRAGSASAAGSGGAGSVSSATVSSASAASAPRSLWYAWAASLLAGVVYLAGLAVYLRANAAALSSFAAAVETSPASALLADAGLASPGAFALDAAGSAPGPALAFPLGAALLAAVFVAFALRFRHGTAGLSLYLYPLGALAPLASLALGPLVVAPAAGLTLALVVAVPALAVTAFLVDVGRTLFAPN